MKIVVLSALLALGPLLGAESNLPPSPQPQLAIVNGSVIDPATGTITQGATVLVEGDRIAAVGKSIAPSPQARIIDARDKFIIPGLWDMHVHLAGVTADPKWSRDAFLPLLIAHGITGVRDMGGNLDALLNWRRDIETGRLVGPRIAAAGPFLAEAKPGTPDTIPVANPEEARKAVRELKARHVDFVKILSKLSRASYFAVAEEAKKEGLDFVGHVPDSISATEAAHSGQKSIEHIMYSNLAFDCSSEETELRQKRAQAAQNRDSAAAGRIRNRANATFAPKKAAELWETFRRKKTWLVPTLIATYAAAHQREAAANVNDPRLAFVPASLRAKWSPEAIDRELSPEVASWYAQQFDNDLKLTREAHADGVPMMAGSDSLDPFNFPGSSLHQELKLLVQAGFTTVEALQAATTNPARFLGRDKAGGVGAIETGRLADFLLLDANPLDDIANTQTIRAVVVNGRFFDRAQLDALLEQARSAVAPQ